MVQSNGITFAPEAGTQHMHDAINKGLPEADLVRVVRLVHEEGYRVIKFYPLINLLSEISEEVFGRELNKNDYTRII